MPSYDSLKASLKEQKPAITVGVVTPGTGVSSQAASPFYAGIELRDSELVQPDYSQEPTQGAAGMDVKFISQNSAIKFSQTKTVFAGGIAADIVADQKNDKQVISRAPKPVNDAAIIWSASK